jgi:SIR2-like domain
MLNDEIKKALIQHLGGQFERALPVLFTGCGFSLSAKNIRGQGVPSVQELKKEIWNICFPGEAFEAMATLQDLYEEALLRHKTKLGELITAFLSVDADSLPAWYQTIFSMPWARAYTLNVDDLVPAIGRRFDLPRQVVATSATTGSADSAGPEPPPSTLEVVHLNGALCDVPDRVTFSVMQYADRLSRTDSWYLRLVSELVSRSFVLIGTQLDEPPLWRHLELRRGRGDHAGRALRELRPRSYLVTPNLDRASQALLAEFNVVWIPLTAE